MIKALLIDADGITLDRKGYFSDIYSRDYGIPADKIIPFFKHEFRSCQLGKTDLKEALMPYLSEWKWPKSVDDFLLYWFGINTIPNEELISQIQQIRASGISCYLVTDKDKYRAEYIRKNLDFEHKFDGLFFSYELGHSKSEPEFFKIVLERLNLNHGEVAFIDDESENVEAADQLGIRSKLYKGPSDLMFAFHS